MTTVQGEHIGGEYGPGLEGDVKAAFDKLDHHSEKIS